MNKGPGRKRIQFTDEQFAFASSAPAKKNDNGCAAQENEEIVLPECRV